MKNETYEMIEKSKELEKTYGNLIDSMSAFMTKMAVDTGFDGVDGDSVKMYVESMKLLKACGPVLSQQVRVMAKLEEFLDVQLAKRTNNSHNKGKES